MKVTHIVASMMTILAILFIFAPMYRKRELQKTKLERDYFSLLSEYHKSSSAETFEKLVTLGIQLFKNTNAEEVKSVIEEDLKNLGA